MLGNDYAVLSCGRAEPADVYGALDIGALDIGALEVNRVAGEEDEVLCRVLIVLS
jgi:hypothetical protein